VFKKATYFCKFIFQELNQPLTFYLQAIFLFDVTQSFAFPEMNDSNVTPLFSEHKRTVFDKATFVRGEISERAVKCV